LSVPFCGVTAVDLVDSEEQTFEKIEYDGYRQRKNGSGCTHRRVLPADSLANVKLVLEDGRLVSVRDNYTAEVSECLRAGRSTDWCRLHPSGVYFRTQDGYDLPLVHPAPDAVDTDRTIVPPGILSSETMHVLCDQSGSMQTMGDAPYEGCRELFDGLPATAQVVVSTFNSTVHIGRQQTPAEALLDGMTSLRRAHGSTSLYDAIIAAVRYRGDHPSQILTLAIVTDGKDTSSSSSVQDAKASIQRLQQRPNHRVLFLGSNQDAVLSASHLGIDAGRALTYGSDHPEQMRTAFRSSSANTQAVRNGGRETGFTSVQRQASMR
jgi:hypothetical protein